MRAGRGGRSGRRKSWTGRQKIARTAQTGTASVPKVPATTCYPEIWLGEGKGQDGVHPDSVLGLPFSKLLETGEKEPLGCATGTSSIR